MIRSPWFTATLILVLAALACSIPGMTGVDTGLVETQVALGIQQTGVAIQQMTLAVPTLPPPAEAYTLAPNEEVVATTSAPVDMGARIKASNILIYEDIVGDPSLLPIVTNTINYMNFSGGKIVNAGDGLGRFKEHANSATKWDLMIVASEVRSVFTGEMFEMMYDHINSGGAVIIEVWDLDSFANGKIAPILSKCGVSFHRDWWRDKKSWDPFSYSIYWLDKFHPLLSTPNTVPAPSYPYPTWFGDAGDLLKLGSGGDAVLVGGLHLDRKSDYGVLASCMGGRMVIQTFSSHDYKWDIIQPLWENYITDTLTKHYEYAP